MTADSSILLPEELRDEIFGETESHPDTSHLVHERPHARDDCHVSTAGPRWPPSGGVAS
jgi:hypothetical protein